MRALLRGQFREAERYAQQGMDCSRQMHVDNAEGVFGMQMFSIRRLQGRLQGLAPIISHFVTTRTGASCWRPGLALIYSELRDEKSARAEFEGLAAHEFADIPRDSLWQTCLSYLSDVCAFLGDQARARILYELMLPFAPLAIVVGNSVVCYGAASRHLGQLSTTLGEWDIAEGHFQHAVELNSRLQALPWVALTKHQFARMLQQRGNSGDQERAIRLLSEALEVTKALGMEWLGLEIEARGDFMGRNI
jgi:tetratricopeptide (TPR) repeat protein